MTTEEIVREIKLRPNVSHITDDLLNDMVKDAFSDIRAYIHYGDNDELPDSLKSVVKNIVLSVITRIGAEGLSSQNFSGISFNYIDDISPGDLKKMRRERRYGGNDKRSTDS